MRKIQALDPILENALKSFTEEELKEITSLKDELDVFTDKFYLNISKKLTKHQREIFSITKVKYHGAYFWVVPTILSHGIENFSMEDIKLFYTTLRTFYLKIKSKLSIFDTEYKTALRDLYLFLYKLNQSET